MVSACQRKRKSVAGRLVRACIVAACVRTASAYESFQKSIPNGDKVRREGNHRAVGHVSKGDGGLLNVFGTDFRAAGFKWTKDLCQTDSDKDSQSNGVELGDPRCIWIEGAEPERTMDISHPGFGDSQTSAAPKGEGGIVQKKEDYRGFRAYLILLVVLLLVLLAVSVSASWLNKVAPKASSKSTVMSRLFWPRFEGWHFGSMIGVGLVWLFHVAFLVLGAHPYTKSKLIKASGKSASVSSLLPMLFAFNRLGLHRVLAFGREAAWIVHIALGDLFLVLSTVHGAVVLKSYGRRVFDKWQNSMGFLSVVIMWISVLPAFLHAMAPKLMPYAGFKIVHWLALPAYLLGILHVLATEVNLEGIIMAVVAFAFIADKIFSKATGKVAVVKWEVSESFVFLQLQVDRFAFAPGQWAHLLVKQISLVPHPFTLVPGTDAGTVQLMIAKNGSFTNGLAKAVECHGGGMPKIILEGPYGHPPLQNLACSAVVLVCGGIGITPGLALLPEAVRSRPGCVWLLWSLRKAELLPRCTALIKPHVGQANVTVALSKGNLPTEDLPCDVKMGSVDVNEWIGGVVQELTKAGVSTVFLFVCGPRGLGKAAKHAASRSGAEITWTVHVEQFHFVPDMSCKRGVKNHVPLNNVPPVQVGSA